MKIKYDPKVDSVYIVLRKGKYSHTRKVTGDIMVDEDKKGNVLGIEILETKKNLPSFDPKKTTFKLETV